MKLSSLKYFYEVTLTLSIRRAAERLHISPSSVSRQLAELEASLGCELIERRADGVALTEAGQVLAGKVRVILTQIDEVSSTIDEIRHLVRGNIHIATVEGMIDNFLPAVITQFRRDYPGVKFTVSALATEKAIAAVEQFEADIGFIYAYGGHDFIEEMATYSQPLLPFAPPGHPLCNEEGFSIRRLFEFPYCLPDRSYKINRLINHIRRVNRIAREPEIISSSLSFLNEYAILNNCVVFVPIQAVHSRVQAGRLVPLRVRSRVLETRHLSLVCRRNRELPLAVRKFAEFAEQEFLNWQVRDQNILDTVHGGR